MFLVGRNGSGKSNLVDAFAFLAEAMTGPLQSVLDRRGGIGVVRNKTSGRSYPPNVGLAVQFGPLNGRVKHGRYAFEIRALPKFGFEVVREQCRIVTDRQENHWFDRRNGRFDANVSGLHPVLDNASLALPLVGGAAQFAPAVRALAALRVYAIEPAKVRDLQEPDSGSSLRRDGGNAASVLKEVERRSEEDLERIAEILGVIVPNTTDVRTKKHGNKLALEFTQKWGADKRVRFEAFNMSDGTLRALGVLLAVFQAPPPSLIVVEEPEATIHPGALGAVLDVLRLASRRMQVVVTTHSPEVLDQKWITEENLRVVRWHEGATQVARISEASRRALAEHLMGPGELLRADALEETAPPAGQALFSEVEAPVLFEELA
ncbi:MAG: ATP-binding protein [Planctomycetota bacterium]